MEDGLHGRKVEKIFVPRERFRVEIDLALSRIEQTPLLYAERDEEDFHSAVMCCRENRFQVIGGFARPAKLPIPIGALALRFQEAWENDRPRTCMQLVGLQAFRIPRHSIRNQVWIGVHLPIERKEVIDSGQHEGIPPPVEDLLQAAIDQAEILEDALLLILASPSVSVKDGRSPAGRMRMHLDLLFEDVVFQGLRQILRDVPQVDFPDAVSGAVEESYFVLAQRQNVETAVFGEEREQRFQMKAVGNHEELREFPRKSEGLEHLRRDEEGQAVAGALPKEVVLEETVRTGQEGAPFGRTKPKRLEPSLSLSKEILETNTILLSIRGRAMRGQVERYARSLRALHETAKPVGRE